MTEIGRGQLKISPAVVFVTNLSVERLFAWRIWRHLHTEIRKAAPSDGPTFPSAAFYAWSRLHTVEPPEELKRVLGQALQEGTQHDSQDR